MREESGERRRDEVGMGWLVLGDFFFAFLLGSLKERNSKPLVALFPDKNQGALPALIIHVIIIFLVWPCSLSCCCCCCLGPGHFFFAVCVVLSLPSCGPCVRLLLNFLGDFTFVSFKLWAYLYGMNTYSIY